MALQFPDIDPVAIAIGPVQVRWYALAYMAGFLLGWAYARYLVRRSGASVPTLDHIDDFLSWAIVGVIAGGRLGYVLFYKPLYFLENPADILKLWHGGMSFHGGASGVIIALLLYAWRKKIPLFRLTDPVCAAVPIGLFFGRLANFVNGELFGRAAGPDVPWAMVFPHGGDAPRHPSQIYEALTEGLLLFFILFVLTRFRAAQDRPGIITGVFLAGYGLFRIGCEFFREPDAFIGFIGDGLTMGQILSAPMVFMGLGVLVYSIFNTAIDKNRGSVVS